MDNEEHECIYIMSYQENEEYGEALFEFEGWMCDAYTWTELTYTEDYGFQLRSIMDRGHLFMDD